MPDYFKECKLRFEDHHLTLEKSELLFASLSYYEALQGTVLARAILLSKDSVESNSEEIAKLKNLQKRIEEFQKAFAAWFFADAFFALGHSSNIETNSEYEAQPPLERMLGVIDGKAVKLTSDEMVAIYRYFDENFGSSSWDEAMKEEWDSIVGEFKECKREVTA